MTVMDTIKPERNCVVPSCRVQLDTDTVGSYGVYSGNGYFCQDHWRMLPTYLKTAITRAIRDNNIRDVVYFIGESTEYINKALPYIHD